MDWPTFTAAWRRAWIPATLLFLAAIFGSWVYVQKQIPPTAKASVAVRDPLTVNPSEYQAAQVSFDAIVRSQRLADRVDERLGPQPDDVSGKLSVEVVIPSNGVNISPLYVVRAKDARAERAVEIVDTAVAEGRELYAELNEVDSRSLEVLDRQLAQAKKRLSAARRDKKSFDEAHGGDLAAQIAAARSRNDSLSEHLSQAQADLATVQNLGDATARSIASARVDNFAGQLEAARTELAGLESDQSEYTGLAARLAGAQSRVEELQTGREGVSASQPASVAEQIKVLDDASIESKMLMKILVYALGVIVGVLLALAVVYVQAARMRSEETPQHIISALGAPALARIPDRAVLEAGS